MLAVVWWTKFFNCSRIRSSLEELCGLLVTPPCESGLSMKQRTSTSYEEVPERRELLAGDFKRAATHEFDLPWPPSIW